VRQGVVYILFLLCCCSAPERHLSISSLLPEETPIVLVDIEGLDATGLAEAINEIAMCRPSAIGICMILDGYDSILLASIASSGKVICSHPIIGGKVIESNKEIVSQALGWGFVDYVFDGERVVGGRIASSLGGDSIVWSFPARLLLQYDTAMFVEVFDSVVPDTPYQVNFNFGSQNFLVLDSASINLSCEHIRDKIILVGQLNDRRSELLVEDSKGVRGKVSAIVAVSNSIMMLIGSDIEEVR